MRMQQKTKAEASKFISNASSGDTGGAGTASPATGVSVQMRANFEKLRQGIADRKAGKRPPTPTEPTPPVIPTGGDGESSAEEDAASVGVWRHFGALDTSTKQEFYVNSVTHEIRVQPPSPLVLELSPPNRYDDLDDIARAVADREGVVVDLSGDGETTTPVKTRAKAKRAIAPAFFSPDAASEFQSATEDLTVSNGAGQEEQVQVEAGNKRESLGKHARSDEDEVDEATTAGESIEVDTNANDGDAAAIVDAVETADVASKWECSRCTLLNESTCPQCEACGYEPVAAPAKKRQRKKMHFQSKISLS
ncbi:hypothetical protein BBJ28_00006666 [Nothophytophthora sp. Chile5]|nr:hypothetical protein BBJ28_00006666 [Nothophytophthora sp. Chile5]